MHHDFWKMQRGNSWFNQQELKCLYTFMYPVRNPAVRHYLQQLLPGRWQKVIKNGNTGEVHYFEHVSGRVAGVKFFPS